MIEEEIRREKRFKYPLSVRLIELISEKSPIQSKSIGNVIAEYFQEAEWKQLEGILSYYMKCGRPVEELSDSYLFFLDEIFQETKYFWGHGKYRFEKFRDVDRAIYTNLDYMRKYMAGLALSGYLWASHVIIFQWYRKMLEKLRGERYLEIGPGHGQYFAEAILSGGFKEYTAIDVSATAVRETSEYVRQICRGGTYKIFQQDCTVYEAEEKYDVVVIAEVLEHLEEPKKMLDSISRLLKEIGYLYITVPVNAPAIDHIYLFDSIESVENMVTDAGYEICERCYATENNVALEKAVKRRMAIIVGVLAKKQEF